MSSSSSSTSSSSPPHWLARFDEACSRRSDSGARAKKKGSEKREKTRGDCGRGRENVCEINFKKLMTVYQNLVYPLIGQI